VIPETIRTPRLVLRPWREADAVALLPVLEANVAHIGPWIPAHVSTPVPLPALAARLAGFADDFAAGRAFRFAMLTPDEKQILGEADLFPRNSTGRVPLAAGDHVELGYWLDAAVTGQGLATEATRALFDLAAELPGMTRAEIHCDPTNERSAAIPRRLGFESGELDSDNQIWRKSLEPVIVRRHS
jgi:RimJ/RimL family protein N-acetyltransferase